MASLPSPLIGNSWNILLISSGIEYDVPTHDALPPRSRGLNQIILHHPQTGLAGFLGVCGSNASGQAAQLDQEEHDDDNHAYTTQHHRGRN